MYNALSRTLCEKFKPLANKLVGSYHCDFRPGRCTTDQIFIFLKILEKTREYEIDSPFVDKAALDSPIRDRMFAAFSELGIFAKLVRFCRITLSNTYIKIGMDLSEPFDTKRGFRQDDPYLMTSTSSFRLFYTEQVFIGRSRYFTIVACLCHRHN